MMSIKVNSLYRQKHLSPPIGVVVVRIDRSSVLGNPFDMDLNEAKREDVVEAHQAWLNVLLNEPKLDVARIARLMANELNLRLAAT